MKCRALQRRLQVDAENLSSGDREHLAQCPECTAHRGLARDLQSLLAGGESAPLADALRLRVEAQARVALETAQLPGIFRRDVVLALGLALRDSGSGLRRGAPMWRKGAAFAVAAAALLAMLWGERFRVSDVLHQQRSFFGVLRVLSSEPGEAPAHVLRHGTTLHGLQFTESALRLFPTAYYGFAGGVGLTLQGAASPAPMRVGVVGLGVGTLAAYGRQGDFYRFYEIDPEVVALAQRAEFFSFLSDSKAEIDIVEADGRLALENEERGDEPGWDVLVLDAFSSDAVPVHLLTREAFQVYRQALAPDGIIAFHISNRYIKLAPPIARAAASTGTDISSDLRVI